MYVIKVNDKPMIKASTRGELQRILERCQSRDWETSRRYSNVIIERLQTDDST